MAACVAATATAFASAPQVSNVGIVQNGARVTVTYDLDAPAVVTMDVTTNDVSIGAMNLWYQTGDVNRLVKTAGSKMITWRPDKAWPGNVTEPGVEVRAVVTAWATNAPPDYMVVDLSGSGAVEYYVSADAVPGGVTNYLYKTAKMIMRKIPAAGVTWTMGSATTERGRSTDESETPHSVAFQNDYYIGIYEVTLKQYAMVKGAIPNYSSGKSYYDALTNDVESAWATYPAVYVRWAYDLRPGSPWPTYGKGSFADASGFLANLNAKIPVVVDLPTSAEWEFACRAESGNALYATDDDPGRDLTNATTDECLGTLAWYKGNSGDHTHPVGEKKPNAWGLYDVLGNAAEWTLDYFTKSFDQSVVVTEPKGPDSGSGRCIRSGKANGDASWNRCARNYTGNTYEAGPYSGFRLWSACEAK